MSSPYQFDPVSGQFCRRPVFSGSIESMLSHHRGHDPFALGARLGYPPSRGVAIGGNGAQYLDPSQPDDVWDRLWSSLQGGKLDPTKLWKFPAQPPPDMASDPASVQRWVGFNDGALYGGIRAGVTVGALALALGGVAGWFAAKRWAK